MQQIDELILELQFHLASSDLAQKKRVRGFKIEVARKQDMSFRMEPDHHNRAHIHIDYGKDRHKASYALDNGELLAGELPTYNERVVVKWIKENRSELNELWNTLKNGADHSVYLKKLNGEA